MLHHLRHHPAAELLPLPPPARRDLATAEVATRTPRISGSFGNFESFLIKSLIFAFGRIPRQTPVKMQVRSLGWL